MSILDISILSISLTVIMSGIYVNFQRKIDPAEKEKMATDQTLLIFRIAVPIALISSIAIYFIGWGEYPISWLIYLGAVLVAGGLSIRWYAIYSLGKAFQVNVTIIKDQQLVKTGIYTYMRHPSYTGLLLYYLGLGLMMHNYISLVILIALPAFAVAMRIQKEEQFLSDHFGAEYRDYCIKSKRLFPFIY
jgi:protein-S-isoprenylcysteine O-methyltransferase Ste14